MKKTIQTAMATRQHHDNVTEVQPVEPAPPAPPLRTFRVTVERYNQFGRYYEERLIHAHHYSTERDLAQFHISQFVQCDNPECGEWHLVSSTPRSIRPVVDVEEVFEQTQAVN